MLKAGIIKTSKAVNVCCDSRLRSVPQVVILENLHVEMGEHRKDYIGYRQLVKRLLFE